MKPEKRRKERKPSGKRNELNYEHMLERTLAVHTSAGLVI